MRYIPASNFAIIYMTTTDKSFEKYDKVANWWEEKSFFRYPYLLISAAHGKQDFNWREKNKIPDDFTLYGDSSGYQQYKGDLQYDPIEVLRWQENNCQLGFSLDYPITSNDNIDQVKLKNKQSIKYIQLQTTNRKNDKMLYLACTHSWSEKQLLEYHKQIPYELINGIGVGECTVGVDDSIPGIFSRIALEASLNPDHKPMHILGTCSPAIIAFVALLERKYGITMSYDSSTYSNGARYRSFHYDGVKRKHFKITPKEKRVVPDQHKILEEWKTVEIEYPDEFIPVCEIETLDCRCPVCSIVSIEDMKEETSQGGSLICLHNLYKEIELDKTIWDLSANKEKLIDWFEQQYGLDEKAKITNLMMELVDNPLDIFVKDHTYTNKFLYSSSDFEQWFGEKTTEIKKKEPKQTQQTKSKKVKQPKSEDSLKPKTGYETTDDEWNKP